MWMEFCQQRRKQEVIKSSIGSQTDVELQTQEQGPYQPKWHWLRGCISGDIWSFLYQLIRHVSSGYSNL